VPRRVLVLGGYGTFGARAAERLARESDIELVIAGRSLDAAEACATALAKGARAKISPAQLDASRLTAAELAPLETDVLINASGPYQTQGYGVARTCIEAGVHYIDLADARAFVTGISTLDDEAQRAGVLVVSGASTVPALSAAVTDAYAPRLEQLVSVTSVIAPANSFDPGLATTRSILGTVGRPIILPKGNATVTGYGWQGLRRAALPGLGRRWIGLVDVPDLDLFPRRYAGLRSVEVYAALEIGAFHLALWGLSWLVRAGLVRDPTALARPLLGAKLASRRLGSERGGMTVTLEGSDPGGNPKRIVWYLIAERSHGPYIPAIPSVILAKRLLDGTLSARGAMPCAGLFTLADFMAEVADLDIRAALA
jgi:Saccharopine dehydrogenase NADP binding domain